MNFIEEMGQLADIEDFKLEKRTLFEPFFQFVAKYIKVQLDINASDRVDESVKSHMALQITEAISRQWLRCLIEEMHCLKQAGMLAGKDETAEYEYFCNKYLRDHVYVEKLLKKYPVLAGMITIKAESAVVYVDELLRHLERDREIIIVKLCDGNEFHCVETIGLNLSDEHFSGKTVAKIRLDNGCVIYHKPHGLSLAVYYTQVERWIFEKCGLDGFSYQICSRGNYGWEKEVSALSCQSKREVASYYTRVGIQACLAYILGITDLHFENLIPHGEYPVIVDLEFIADRRLSDCVHPDRMDDMLKDTVANTGILPTAIGDGSGVNIGGLGETSEQTAPYKMPVIINSWTSDMAIAYCEPKIKADRNLPIWNGQKKGYQDYVPCIIDGFTKAYETILHNKELFIQKFASGFNHKSRFLIRSTQEYFMYQNTMNFPTLLKNQEERKLMLFHMDKGLRCNETYRKDILGYEMDAVCHHVIPVFYAHEEDLYMGNGKCLPNYFSYDGKDQIVKRLEKLSRKDCRLQRKVMEIIFLSRWKQGYKAAGNETFQKREEDVFNKTFLELRNEISGVKGIVEPLSLAELSPEKIADLLAEDMLTCKEQFGWIGIHYSSSGQIYPGFVDLYLYNGLCGIAIFFAALCKQNATERYSRICQDVIETLFEHTNQACSGNLEMDENWGLFTGETSLVYTYLILYEITGEEIFLDYAGKHGRLILKNLEKIDGSDLLSGKAGVIVALVLVYEKTGENFWLDAAEMLEDILEKEAVVMEKGIGWKEHGSASLAGMAHGNSGIALAFAYLYRCTHKSEYLEIIKAAICYEDSLYDAGIRNWMDLRNCAESGNGSRDTVAWCHGAAGILSARTAIYRMTGLDKGTLFGITHPGNYNVEPDSIDEAVKTVIDKVRESKKRDLCLCHGNLGLLEILNDCLEGLDLSGDDYLKKTGIVYDDLRDWDSGHDKLSLEDRNNPGFMVGLSGIGYVLLRKREKELPGVFAEKQIGGSGYVFGGL